MTEEKEYFMKRHFWIVAAAFALCGSGRTEVSAHAVRQDPASARDVPAATAAAGALAAYFRTTEDLHAAFTQTVYAHRGEEKSSGEVWLARPGKFYWDYRRPDRQKIISDGKTVYHYDLDLEQISVRARDELVGDVAIQVLSGELSLDRAFTVSERPLAKSPTMLQPYGKDGRIYHLTPKNTQEGYDAIWITMQKGNLSAIMMDGGRGQQTMIVFRNLRRNTGIPASRFRFTPPPGVDVVGSPGS